MKLLPYLLTLVSALTLVGVAGAENVQDFLTAAQVAYQKGDIATAKRNFEMVNRMDPRNAVAIGFLKQIAAGAKKESGGEAVEKSLASLIIPKIEFKEATLGSALDFMKKKATEISGGKQAVNFVVQPGIDQAGTPVTLNLRDIPFTEALRYVGELANISFEYQKYAIMVRPKGAPVATTNKGPAESAPTTLPGQ